MPSTLLLVASLLAAGAATVPGCNKTGQTNPEPKPPTKVEGPPSVRLYLLSTVAGALEPCGCSKNQLGGLDHLAAYVTSEKAKAPHSLMLAAGPMLYVDPKLEKSHATQDRWKAETIAAAMGDMDLGGWSPGYNDFASGHEALAAQAKKAGATLLSASVSGATGTRLYDVGGVKVGVIGLAEPKGPMGNVPDGVTLADGTPADRAQKAVAALKKEGAKLFVVVAALPRGAALRIADGVPEIDVLAIGKPSSQGTTNTPQPPPQMIGKTLVVETANHAQTVSVVDVFLEDGASEGGDIRLADGGGIERAAQIDDLTRRINELQARITSWEQGGKVDPKDLAARKADLKKLETQRAELQKEPTAPSGSYFRYRVQEVREELGMSDAVHKTMVGYYKRVNEHNKKALADLTPPEPSDGQPRYIGQDECSTCHLEPQEVWEKTAHAKAYATLQKDFKEYNLECVGCHVTGYGKPGGSTVTHNEGLKNVQCETCHGPGSLHAKDPENKGLITLKPDPKGCVSQCHHPPHVEGFDPVAKMDLILGPGHGK